MRILLTISYIKNGYIYSQTVRGANADLKEYVLSGNGYEESSHGFKIKSRIITTNIWVENISGKRIQVQTEQKQVVFYSPYYAKRAKYERKKAFEKAKKSINNTKNGKMPTKGSLKYIISTPVDKETGEIYECDDVYFIDEERIEEEEKFDGYYAIVNSELKTRPVYLYKKEHIEAHFLTCFVSLLLLRLIQINTNEKYSTKTLINEMKNITGTYVDKNYYMFDYYNEIVEDLGKTLGIDFSKRFMTLGEIKKIFPRLKIRL